MQEPKFRKLSDHGDLMTIKEFKDSCEGTYFIDDDGLEETRKILVDSIKDQIRTLQEFENDVAKASLTGVPKDSTLLSKKICRPPVEKLS